MGVRIHNTLTRQKEELTPGGLPFTEGDSNQEVTIYSCGPTVYSHAHIGNFRTFMFNDFLRRYLKFRGIKVNHAMNITDIDDKTIKGSLEENISLQEYTQKYTEIFFEDLKTLNIEEVEHTPKATESIPAMEEIILKLAEKGLTYEKEGSIYFSIDKFKEYGRLSKLDKREIKTGLRYDTDEYEKDDVRDFVLWKAPKENEPFWETSFGKGRPGWHIECSAMIREIFNSTIDIHTGGVDLVFPHHENEIAQSEAAYNEPFVRQWIHVEHLLVNGSKMSKSMGNFYTLRDLLDKGYSPRAIRYVLITAHYRKQVNFTLEGLDQADQALQRIDNFLIRLNDVTIEDSLQDTTTESCDTFIKAFTEAIDDDLNISKGMGEFFEFLHKVNALISDEEINTGDVGHIISVLEKVDSVLGVIFFTEESDNSVDAEYIEKLIEERAQAKADKNWGRADEIRDELTEMNIVLEDTKDGTRWIRKR